MKTPSDKVDRFQSPAYLLWLASNAWQRQMRRVLEPWQLTHVQFAVLSSIDRLQEEAGCVTQAAVARWIDIDENMNSQVLKSLEERKLVTKLKHPTDGRAFQLGLTDEGQRVVLESRVVVKQLADEFFDPLGARRPDLVELMKVLVDTHMGS